MDDVRHSAYDDEPYCGVNGAEDLYGPDPFDEDNTNPNDYWCPIFDDDEPPAARQHPPAPHPVEEGNSLHQAPNPTECDRSPPMRARRMTVRKSTGGMMSVPRARLTNQQEINHCPPFLIRIKTTARKSTIQYLPSRALAPKRPAESPIPPTPAAPRTKQTARKSIGGM